MDIAHPREQLKVDKIGEFTLIRSEQFACQAHDKVCWDKFAVNIATYRKYIRKHTNCRILIQEKGF